MWKYKAHVQNPDWTEILTTPAHIQNPSWTKLLATPTPETENEVK